MARVIGRLTRRTFADSLSAEATKANANAEAEASEYIETLRRQADVEAQAEAIEARDTRAMKRSMKRESAYAEYKSKTKEDSETRKIYETLLTPEDEVLIKQRSVGCRTRNCPGTTSCRHLQMLYLLLNLAKCIAKQLGPLGDVRQILSQLWNGAIKNNCELYKFYGNNNATDMHYSILTDLDIDTIFNDGPVSVFPFGLVKIIGNCTRIFHYFLLLKEGDKYYIYNANGSDTVRAHPRKIEITRDEFLAFIRNVNNPLQKDAIDSFILTYFMEGATTPFFYDEGKCRTMFVDIEKGKRLDLASYENFYVAYFPTVEADLIKAAKQFARSVPGWESFLCLEIDDNPERNHKRGGTRKRRKNKTKKRSKQRTNRLKRSSFSRRAKR